MCGGGTKVKNSFLLAKPLGVFCNVANGQMRATLMALIVLVITVGCTITHTYQCGDARVHESTIHPKLESFRHTTMDLPWVSLAQTNTRVFRVRNLHAFGHPQGGFPDQIEMVLPQRDVRMLPGGRPQPEADLPWRNAVVSVTFRDLDGTVLFQQVLRLREMEWSYFKGKRVWGWHARHYWKELKGVDWGRGHTNYDAEIVVEVPSDRKRGALRLQSAYGP
jgi:hypothetical protein